MYATELCNGQAGAKLLRISDCTRWLTAPSLMCAKALELKIPSGGCAGYCTGREGTFAAPLWNREAVPGVSLGAWRVAVMVAKHLLNFVQGRGSFAARLPVPEHDKTLSTHTAMGFRIPIRALAEYLHLDLMCAWGDPRHEGDDIAALAWMNIPRWRQCMANSGEGVERGLLGSGPPVLRRISAHLMRFPALHKARF